MLCYVIYFLTLEHYHFPWQCTLYADPLYTGRYQILQYPGYQVGTHYRHGTGRTETAITFIVLKVGLYYIILLPYPFV